MLLLKCPWCGPRAFIEFTYGGDATQARPDEGAPDEAWHDHVYLRANRVGPHPEHWHHTHGCRMWIKVVRDTVTHEVIGVGPLGAAFRESPATAFRESPGEPAALPQPDRRADRPYPPDHLHLRRWPADRLSR